LPGNNVERAQIACKLTLQEHPALAGFGAGDNALLGLLAQTGGREAQKGRGLMKVKGADARVRLSGRIIM